MSEKLIGIGLMSGTSLDGLDIVASEFFFIDDVVSFNILKTKTIIYNQEWSDRLSRAMKLSGNELMQLNADFGKFSAKMVKDFLTEWKILPDFISSHGHTVFHQPQNGFSTQIGCGAVIAAETGITTVCDFRSTDVALGGQGAPLVPIGDELLFSDYDACLNIGGIANISFNKNGKRIAFDVCAANMLLNFLANKSGKKMDEGGVIASGGNIQAVLLQNLNMNPYFKIKEKKSLGKEWVDEHMIRKIEMSNASVQDKLRTCSEHIAQKIAEVIIQNRLKKTLITGGGAYNSFLIERIRSLTREEIIVPENHIVEFKEALIFALLGALRLKNKVNVLNSVTGAKRDSCSGTVYLGS
jgi:anhydro-N-acetylmuramic acid kinase